MSIDEMEQRLDRLEAEIAWERYLIASGQKAESNTAAIYAGHAALFTRENIRRVQAALAAPGTGGSKAERIRLSRLALALISFYVEAGVAPLRDALESQQQALIVATPDGPIPYLRAGEQIECIPDPARRRAVWQAQGDAVLASLAPAGLRLWQARQRVARELGYRSYAAMFARLKGIHLRRLAHDAELVLAATEASHRSALATALRTYAGVGLPEATSADVRFVLRQMTVQTRIGAVDAMGAVRATLAGLGVDLDHLPGLAYDLADRPLKQERAAVYVIDPPHRQIITCRPKAGHGVDFLHALLHETGHGLHFVHTDPALPPVVRRNPDLIVGEAMAFLVDGLVREPAWLQAVLGLDAARVRAVTAVQCLRRRYLVRQMAGACRYLLALDRDTSERAAAAYEQLLSEATLVQLHRGGYSIALDPELYAASYFYADMVTAQLVQSLRTAYGRCWWTDPACGRRLKEIWQHCSSGSSVDLVRSFGHQYVSPAALLRQLGDDGMEDAAIVVG